MGLQGAVRGRAWVTTTRADLIATRPLQLWVPDFALRCDVEWIRLRRLRC